jgi:hypothetical protein
VHSRGTFVLAIIRQRGHIGWRTAVSRYALECDCGGVGVPKIRSTSQSKRLPAATHHAPTDLFNVCGFHHRNPSLCNFGLIPRFPALPEYAGLIPPTVEVIGDMAHVHPMTVQVRLQKEYPSHSTLLALLPFLASEDAPGYGGLQARSASRLH